MATPLRDIAYRLDATARGAWPGRHPGASGHGGQLLRRHVPLIDAADSRRLDLLASLRDPYCAQTGSWLAREHSQRLAVTVAVLADLSASMAYVGPLVDDENPDQRGDSTPPKIALLAELTESLAWSAWKSGDRFGFFGAADRLLPDFTALPARVRSAGQALAERVRGHQPAGASARGLLDALPLLGRRRALVFIVSDLHWPDAALEHLLQALSPHQVVPVRLAWADEADLGPRAGLAPLVDAESGLRRWRWWRPALRARWRADWAAQRARQDALLRRHCVAAVDLGPRLDADRLSRHFQSTP